MKTKKHLRAAWINEPPTISGKDKYEVMCRDHGKVATSRSKAGALGELRRHRKAHGRRAAA